MGRGPRSAMYHGLFALLVEPFDSATTHSKYALSEPPFSS